MKFYYGFLSCLQDRSNFLRYLGQSSKSHHGNQLLCMFLQLPRPVDMKNIVKY